MTFKAVEHFSRFSRRQFLGLSAGITGLIFTASAFADRPHPAGKIAFVSGRFALTTQQKIWIISPDGSNLRRLTKDGDEPGEDHPAWSPDGRRIAFSAVRKGKRRIYIRNSDGKNETPLIHEAALAEDCREPAWSPDGKTIVFCAFRADQKSDHISVIAADGTNLRQLTSGDSYNWSPCFSPYGEHIVFESTRDGVRQIYAMNADGSNLLNLSKPAQPDSQPAYSPAGRQIAFKSGDNGVGASISVMLSDGSNRVNLTKQPGLYLDPAWSPSGDWIAFTRCAGGAKAHDPMHIYIMKADGTGCVSLTEGRIPADNWGPSWGPD